MVEETSALQDSLPQSLVSSLPLSIILCRSLLPPPAPESSFSRDESSAQSVSHPAELIMRKSLVELPRETGLLAVRLARNGGLRRRPPLPPGSLLSQAVRPLRP